MMRLSRLDVTLKESVFILGYYMGILVTEGYMCVLFDLWGV